MRIFNLRSQPIIRIYITELYTLTNYVITCSSKSTKRNKAKRQLETRKCRLARMCKFLLKHIKCSNSSLTKSTVYKACNFVKHNKFWVTSCPFCSLTSGCTLSCANVTNTENMPDHNDRQFRTHKRPHNKHSPRSKCAQSFAGFSILTVVSASCH